MRTLSAFFASALALTLIAGPSYGVEDPDLSGRVTNAAGIGVAGASVNLTRGSTIIASQLTSSTGHYAIDAPADTYTVQVVPATPELSGASALWIDVPRITSLDFILTEPALGRIRVTGTVSLDTGASLSAGNALFGGAGNRIESDGHFSMLQPTGITGSWGFSGSARTGTQTLNISASGGPRVTLLQDTDVDFVVPMTQTSLRVTDTTGTPISNATVRLNVGGYGNSPGASELFSGAAPFALSWNVSGITDATGNVVLSRPAMNALMLGVLSVDGPDGKWASSFTETAIPARSGQFTQALQPRVVSAPSPAPTPSVVPAPSPTPSPSATVTTSPTAVPVKVTTRGSITYSDGSPVPEAMIIPTEPMTRVNGGNSADSEGVFAVSQNLGFTGNWQITARPQARLPLRDPLWFTLKGGNVRKWSADQEINFVIPTNLYRVRVVDAIGNPIQNAHVAVKTTDSAGNTARVELLPGESVFEGSWAGWDYTGSDGFAQIPALDTTNSVQLELTVNTDPQSRYLSRSLLRTSANLSETVIVLQTQRPIITSIDNTRVAPGDSISLTGQNLGGTQQVLIGSIPQSFTVESESRIKVDIASNSVSGTLRIESPGYTVASRSITVTSPDLLLTQSSLDSGMVGSAYNFALVAEGGLAPYRFRRVSGALPVGTTLTSTGSVTGMPTRAQSGSTTFAVTDARGSTVSRVISWTIAPKPATIPGAIARLGASAGADRITLSWLAPRDNGGNAITSYQVQSSVDGTSWDTLVESTGTTSMGVSFAAPAGISMWYRVAAINPAGVGTFAPTSIVGPIAAYSVPSAPQNLQVARISSSQVRISWEPPATSNGRAISSYRVRTSNEGSRWTTVAATNRGLSLTIRLPQGASVWLQVAAQNQAGLGPWLQVNSGAS